MPALDTVTVFSFDGETFLIRPGAQAPPVVCLQGAIDLNPPDLWHANSSHGRALAIIEAILRDDSILLNGHNVAYDLACCATSSPYLLPLIFRAYDLNRITCTVVRAKLGDIAAGKFSPQRTYHLNEVADRLSNGAVVLDKTDPWRLRYGELWNVPVEAWPPEAVSYAMKDASAQQYVYFEQERQIPAAHLVDQFRQSQRAFMLYLQSCWGIRTNPVQVERYHASTLVEANKDKAIAEAAGLVRAPHNRPKTMVKNGVTVPFKGPWDPGSRYLKAAMARMVQVCQALGEPIPLTDTGIAKQKEMKKALGREVTPLEVYQATGECVSLDEDSCLATGDEILEAFQRYGSLRTTLSRVDRLRHGYDLPIQARFNSPLETGRTSCSQGDVDEGVSPPAWGSQVQNPPTKAGVRECFVARTDNPLLPSVYVCQSTIT